MRKDTQAYISYIYQWSANQILSEQRKTYCIGCRHDEVKEESAIYQRKAEISVNEKDQLYEIEFSAPNMDQLQWKRQDIVIKQ